MGLGVVHPLLAETDATRPTIVAIISGFSPLMGGMVAIPIRQAKAEKQAKLARHAA